MLNENLLKDIIKQRVFYAQFIQQRYDNFSYENLKISHCCSLNYMFHVFARPQ